jgi:hypothetical protein
MGKASRKKGASRPKSELIELLSENVKFLEASSQAYDAGFEGEAKRLAVVLRVLLHDTKQSHSLLQQIGVKSRLRFDDSAVPINPSNLLPEPGLVMLKLTAGSGGRYIATLDDLSPSRVKSRAAFAGWWSNPVMKLSDGRTWSRRDLVLTLANQEGGAHVDPTLDPDYEHLARLNALGWMFVDERGERPFEGNAVAAAVRQVAHEVIATLRREQLFGG